MLGTEFTRVEVPGELKARSLTLFQPAGGSSTHLCIFTGPGYQPLSQCSSSLRYKTEVRPLLAGLDLINRLRPITFAWKRNNSRDLGFGAEDVAAVEPLLVTYNPQGQIEGVKYDALSAVLVNAVKQQQAQIQRQQNLIKQQETRLAGQQKLLQQHQSQVEALKKLVCMNHSHANVCKYKDAAHLSEQRLESFSLAGEGV